LIWIFFETGKPPVSVTTPAGCEQEQPAARRL